MSRAARRTTPRNVGNSSRNGSKKVTVRHGPVSLLCQYTAGRTGGIRCVTPTTSTAPTDCSLAGASQMVRLACLIVMAALASVGCGESGSVDFGGTRVLTKEEAVKLLRQLPYHYEFRSVATPKG